MLEPYEGKLSRTVLRRGRASNCSFLFNMFSKKQQFSCCRFWRISQKFPVIISTEILENLAESFH